MLLNVFLVIAGTALMGYGIWRTFGHEQPGDTIGAFLGLIGFVMALMGTIMISVPGFFG